MDTILTLPAVPPPIKFRPGPAYHEMYVLKCQLNVCRNILRVMGTVAPGARYPNQTRWVGLERLRKLATDTARSMAVRIGPEAVAETVRQLGPAPRGVA